MSEQPDQSEKDSADRALNRRVNLQDTPILLIDNAWGIEILSRVFVGFGARHLHKAENLEAAGQILAAHPVDLIVTEALMQDGDTYAFIRDLRLNANNERNRFSPVILLSAHTASAKITEARDCGANFFVAKPVSPKVMMERVLWVAAATRQYLQTDTYAGPDRRFHDQPPPHGVMGRRRNDPRPSIELIEKSA